MIFKSRQVNLDPKPYLTEDVRRIAGIDTDTWAGGLTYAPRPEFELTRDPYPWLYPDGDRGANNPGVEGAKWAPRRDLFDTPVNRVLVYFREAEEREFLLANLGAYLSGASGWASPDEAEHARKLLTRLAGWSG